MARKNETGMKGYAFGGALYRLQCIYESDTPSAGPVAGYVLGFVLRFITVVGLTEGIGLEMLRLPTDCCGAIGGSFCVSDGNCPDSGPDTESDRQSSVAIPPSSGILFPPEQMSMGTSPKPSPFLTSSGKSATTVLGKKASEKSSNVSESDGGSQLPTLLVSGSDSAFNQIAKAATPDSEKISGKTDKGEGSAADSEMTTTSPEPKGIYVTQQPNASGKTKKSVSFQASAASVSEFTPIEEDSIPSKLVIRQWNWESLTLPRKYQSLLEKFWNVIGNLFELQTATETNQNQIEKSEAKLKYYVTKLWAAFWEDAKALHAFIMSWRIFTRFFPYGNVKFLKMEDAIRIAPWWKVWKEGEESPRLSQWFKDTWDSIMGMVDDATGGDEAAWDVVVTSIQNDNLQVKGTTQGQDGTDAVTWDSLFKRINAKDAILEETSSDQWKNIQNLEAEIMKLEESYSQDVKAHKSWVKILNMPPAQFEQYCSANGVTKDQLLAQVEQLGQNLEILRNTVLVVQFEKKKQIFDILLNP